MTSDNRHEYVRLVLEARFQESRKAVDAIKRGLGCVVPLRMLALMTWRELEVHVCGRPIIDLSLLKANTVYNGCSADDDMIK